MEEITGIHERRRQQFLNLLDLPEHIQEAILYSKETAWGGAITEKHARALVVLKHDTEEQEKLFQKILSSDTSDSGDRALSKARNIKIRAEPLLNLTFRYRGPQDLIRQLKEKLKDLAGE